MIRFKYVLCVQAILLNIYTFKWKFMKIINELIVVLSQGYRENLMFFVINLQSLTSINAM